MPIDKKMHLLAGAIIGAVLAILALLGGFSLKAAASLAMLGATFAGLIKEAWDDQQNQKARRAGLRPPHSVDPWDFHATAAGGATVALLLLMFWS